jgi:aspartate-semialdehyde dehydrogenase
VSPLRVAVVGATGAVGQVMLETLAVRGWNAPDYEIVPFASERSAGRTLENGMIVQPLSDDTIRGFDIAIFSAGGGVSGEWSPKFAEAGAVVVDNSSRWRTDPEVPLVVAEVNPQALDAHRGIVANPNCSTMQLMVALKPIHAAAGIERLVVATYQSVSGTGVAAVEELRAQERAILDGREPESTGIYPYVIADNVIGAAGNFPDGDDSTDEERKMMFETRKILADDSIGISVTCARVPVPYSHSEAVNVQTREPLSAADCRALLEAAPGITVLDDPSRHLHPTARDAAGHDDVFVGRIREDESHPRALNLWIVSDNLRKGAATNAVQLAELLQRRGLIGSASRAA